MGTSNQLSIKQIICFNIIAAEKVAGNICQGLAVKLGKAFIYDNRDIDVKKSHTLVNNVRLRFKIYPN